MAGYVIVIIIELIELLSSLHRIIILTSPSYSFTFVHYNKLLWPLNFSLPTLEFSKSHKF